MNSFIANGLSAIFEIFKVRAPSYNTKYKYKMIHSSLYIDVYFLVMMGSVQ